MRKFVLVYPTTMDFPNFPLRLAETIAWCVSHQLEPKPPESDEVKRRREKIDRAGELMQKAHRNFKHDDITELFKNPEYQEAARLFKDADPMSIAPLKDQLRTVSLRPYSKFDRPLTRSERISIVEDVATRRAGLLKTMGWYPETSLINLTEGRILLYAPDDNLSDGAAVYPSKGFFDVNNVSPWDTWVCFADRYLVSWVPPVLEGLAEVGIKVNPEECIKWATPGYVNSLINPDSR
jgi:hypothetical protein